MSGLVRAGAPISLTGRFATQGVQAGRGLQLWVDAVNEAGGLAVRRGDPPARLALVIHDDESRVASAAALTERLIVDEHVDLLFSPYSSVLTLAAAEVAERHGRVLWNHGGSTDAIAERGWRRVVNLLSPASRYFAGVLEYARAVEPSARTVALSPGPARGTFPAAVAAGAEAHAARLGFEMVMRATYRRPSLPFRWAGRRGGGPASGRHPGGRHDRGGLGVRAGDQAPGRRGGADRAGR